MYGGFYKTRIKSVLLCPEEIFYRAGYRPTSNDNEILSHQGPIDKQNLLMLALDCKIAAEDCRRLIEEYHMTKKIGQTLSDVIGKRLGLNLKELEEHKKAILNKNLYPTLPAQINKNGSPYMPSVNSENSYHKMKLLNDGHSEQVKFASLSTDLKNPISSLQLTSEEKIPELHHGTLDEHLKQSLQVVNNFELHRPQIPQFKDSAMVKSENASLASDSSLITPSNMSNPTSGNTYPPVRYRSAMYPSHANSVSIDEGLPPSLKDHSSQQMPSFNQQSSSVESSFRQTRLQPQQPKPYALNKIEGGMSSVSVHPSNKIKGAPPVPNRALKPVPGVPSVNKDVKLYSGHSLQLPNKTDAVNFSQSAFISSNKALSDQVNTETVMRHNPGDISRFKSNSLRNGRNQLSNPITPARSAKSMELRFWQCRICSNSNLMHESVCTVCKHHRGHP